MRKKASWSGREIVVGVTGSIAAYKSAELVSTLVQRGAGVTVAMTEAATHFVGPITFQALTRRRVLLNPFDAETVLDPTHVTAAEKADLVVVAPATANTIAKMAHGIADDVLTSLLLAVECPVLVAPAMNTRMWNHKTVRENFAKLKRLGVRTVGPEKGFLAERSEGMGRMSEPEKIVSVIEQML